MESISTELEGPPGGCPEFAPFDIDLGMIPVEPKETVTVDYVVLSWCCTNCPTVTCAWKSKIELTTSIGDFKTESDFFRKRFKSSCPSCPSQPEGPSAPSGPQINCEPTVLPLGN